MQNRKTFLIKYLALMLILVSALLLSACRTRITNNNEVSNVYYDEDGYLSETYEMRRSELSLSTAKKPLLPDFGPIEDEEEEFDTGESINYEPEEEEYVEPPEVQNANRTTNRTTRRYSSGSTGGGSSSRTTTERVTIKFDANGGKCNTTEKKVYKGSKIGTLPEATKDGKTTRTWSLKKDGSGIVKSTDTVNSNVTLYACWEEKKKDEEEKFTVTFDAQGGTCSEKTRPVVKGKTIGSLPKATNGNKKLLGWSTSQKGSTIDSNYKVTKNVTLYAQWKDPDKKSYKVTFEDGDGNILSQQEVVEGKSATAPTDPKKTGYNFVGWDKPFDNVKENLTVIAKWVEWTKEEYWDYELEEASKKQSSVNCYVKGDKNLIEDCKATAKNDDSYDVAFIFADSREEFDIKYDPESEEFKNEFKNKTVYYVSNAARTDSVTELAYKIKIFKYIHGDNTIDPDNISSDEDELGIIPDIQKIQ